MPSSTTAILMVEDDPNDVFMLRRALDKEGLPFPVHVVQDGEEAIHYLEGHSPFSDRSQHPFPCLILLDLKLPRMNGLELLSWLRARDDFKELPVFMLTSSSEPQDRREAERFGVDAYRVKPLSFGELIQVAREIRRKSDEHCGEAAAS